jgi:hypothetical protein
MNPAIQDLPVAGAVAPVRSKLTAVARSDMRHRQRGRLLDSCGYATARDALCCSYRVWS